MKKIIYFFVIFAIIISILLIFVKIEVIGIQIGWILITIEGCYLILFSFGKVEVNEVGALFLWGKPVRNLKPGLYFAPKGVFSVRKEIGTEIQNEIPAEAGKIYHGKEEIPEGMFGPIRIKFGPARDNDPKKLRDDPYNHSMVVEVVPIVKWRILDLKIFFEKMGTIKNCENIIAFKAIEVIGDDFSEITPARALQKLGETNTRMETELENQTMDSGIEIIDAYVKPFDFPYDLNSAVVNVSKERQNARSTVISAEASKEKRVQEGLGEASFIKETLEARATGEARIKKLILEAEAIGIDKLIDIANKKGGEVIVWMKTLATALEKSKYSIIPGSELFKATSGIQEMLGKIKGGV